MLQLAMQSLRGIGLVASAVQLVTNIYAPLRRILFTSKDPQKNQRKKLGALTPQARNSMRANHKKKTKNSDLELINNAIPVLECLVYSYSLYTLGSQRLDMPSLFATGYACIKTYSNLQELPLKKCSART